MGKGLGLRENWLGRTAVVAVTGEVDMASSPDLAAAVADCLAKAPAALIIDLSRTEFLASAGIGVLVGACKKADHDCIGFSIVADGAASRPLKVMNMDGILNVQPTMEQAQKSVRRD